MAILRGFPASNTISPGIRLPMCNKCNTVKDWHDVKQCGDEFVCSKCEPEEADPFIEVIDTPY
jgi:hypothetical protein